MDHTGCDGARIVTSDRELLAAGFKLVPPCGFETESRCLERSAISGRASIQLARDWTC